MGMKLLLCAEIFLNITIALIIYVSALNGRALTLPLWCRIGLLITALGLIIQCGVNFTWVVFNIAIIRQKFPFWILQDVGMAIIAFYYYWQVSLNKK
ncbi:hypothetical protein ACG1VR_02545 [Cedecea davisae]|uniref:hypothetical protein n=1 Tax=Cedecea davisae TaxID=158484 RepID=UPI00376EDE0A